MEDYQKRAIEERQELNERIVKLTTFIFTHPVKIEKDETDRMKIQLHQMVGYSSALDDRIDNFK